MAAATIRDVAKHAGVGVGTVSRVLNENPAVSNATRKKVLSAIQDLDFTPNVAARRLSLGKSLTIGVVVPFFTYPSVVERLRGVVSILKHSEYDMILFDVESVSRRNDIFKGLMQRERVDGLLIVSLMPTNQEVARLNNAGITTVLVEAKHPQLNCITTDNVRGGYQATKHLIELGHVNIAYLSDYLDDPLHSPVRDRFTGYRQALEEANIPFNEAYHVQGEHGRTEARMMANQLLDLDVPPTAVFAYSDTQAIGTIEAVTAKNLHVPEHLSVIGFDNIEVSEYVQLTTIDQQLYQSGARSAEMLLEKLLSPSETPEHITLDTELVLRRTTSFPA